MTATGKSVRTIVYRFDGPAITNNYPWTVTDSAGDTAAAAHTAGSFGLSKGVTLDTECVWAEIANSPFTLQRMRSLEFLVNIDILDAKAGLTVGIASGNAAEDPDTATHSCYLKTAGSTVTVESDDNVTNNDDVATNASIAVGWNRIRFDFWQQSTTVSPPSLSKGYQVTISLTNDKGFARRMQVQSSLDMDASKAIAVSPYYKWAAIAADPAAETTAVLSEVCVEYVAPY